ncbi:hypothetical protein LNJ40_11855 [Tenacibaculum dicentrarchi]|nr:hypothetical protein [Tenacibaculum dicentrarchi]MCD8425981.1 hypothetical protein [Tenacibaculum dicentrarchi]
MKITRIIFTPIILVSILGFLVYKTTIELIPDYLKLQNFSRIYDLHNQILNALVTIFGLYISVSLIAHEVFKQKSGIALNKSLLINKTNIRYIGLLIISIVFVFISSLLIPSTSLKPNEVNVIYFNCYLFLISIFLFVPISFNLFKSLRPEIYAQKELEKLNNENIFIEKINNDIIKQAELIENNPLEKISLITLNLIEKKENIQSFVMINNVTEKLGILITNNNNVNEKKYIIERLISFYIKIIDYSLLLPNNSIILNAIFNSVKSLYGLIENITDLHYFTELFFNRYINRLFENNREESIFESIETFQIIIEEHIKNSLPEHDNIFVLYQYRERFEKGFIYPQDNEEISNGNRDWDEVNNLFEIFTMFINKSIKYNKPDILNDCFEKINRLNSNLKHSKVSVYKQMFFYIKSANIISDYTYEAFSKKIFNKGVDAKNVTPILLEQLIINQHPAARTVLRKYCELLIKLQKIDKLDFWFLGGLECGIVITEGDLGRIVRRCIFNYEKNQTVKDCLEDCISTYEILKKYYEKNTPSDIRYYYQLKKRFETMTKILNSKNLDFKILNSRISKIINTFETEH